MKRSILISLFCLFILMQGRAQRQVNQWYFGVLAGMDFNSGSPVALTGGMINTNEGCAAISDTAGSLLFYTDGVTVWNRQHAQMPNGAGLNGGISATQSALIAPQPGNDSLYYIFTVDEIGGPKGFCYSIVNMKLDSGRGDVAMKNTIVLNNVTEKLAGVFHANNHDIWIMVHEWGTDAFFAYLLTDTGLTASNPVISHAGTIHNTQVIQNTYGQMKFNSCGNRLVAAIAYQDTVDIFDFDNISGTVSNPITLSFADHVYGAEFSPDNSKLYISCYDPAATLSQFDLNAPNIQGSATILSITPDIYALQLGPDHKIYATKSFSQFLGVINDPDLAGIACNYVDMGFDLDPNFNGITSSLGLPGFIQSYFHPDFPAVLCNMPVASMQSSDTTLCEKNCIDFTDLTAGTVTSWQWLFPGAVPSSDTVQNPTNICYNTYGSFDVTLIVTNILGSDTLFLPGFITVLQSPPIPSVSVIGGDTMISSMAFSYQWYLNGLPIAGATNQLYIATAPGNYYVVVSDSNGCESSSTGIVVSGVDEAAVNGMQVSVTTDNQSLTVSVTGYREEEISFQLFNLIGGELYRSGKKGVYNGSVNEKIPLPPSGGMYFLVVSGRKAYYNRKLVF